MLRREGGRDSERPAHRGEEWPPLAAPGESPRTETKTQHSHKKKKKKKSLDSLAKIVVNRIALDYLLDEQGGICAVPSTTFCTWINSLRKLTQTQLHITEQAIWFKKVTPSTGSFFDLSDLSWFGSWHLGLRVRVPSKCWVPSCL